jgi:hypothetical protein
MVYHVPPARPGTFRPPGLSAGPPETACLPAETVRAAGATAVRQPVPPGRVLTGQGRDWPFHRTPVTSGSDHSARASFDGVGWFTMRFRSTWGPTAYAQMA